MKPCNICRKLFASLFVISVFFALYQVSKDKPPYDPLHAEQIRAGIKEFLGRGYRGYEFYADPRSISLPLFDLPDEKDVNIQDGTEWDGRFASGETKTEFYNEFFGAASVSGIYNGFSGEITSNFNKSTLKSRANSFATANITQTYYRLDLLDSAQLKKDVLNDLLNMEPVALFDKYGTHYLKSIYIGGKISYSSFVDRTKISEGFKLEATVKASYAEVVTGSASGGGVDKKDIEQVTSNKRLLVKGGDPAEAARIMNSVGEPSENYTAWSRSVPKNMTISDIANGGVVPIYELVEDPERQEILKDAWEPYMASHTDETLKEDEPEVIKKNSSFLAKSEDGRYFGEAPYDWSYSFYYPTMTDSGIELQLDSGSESLENNNNVKIKTSESFDGGWADYVYLGAFFWKGNLYYWVPYDAKTNWIIKRVIPGSDPNIRYGDEVLIKNDHYDQYLAPAKNGFLTTTDDPYSWTLLSVPTSITEPPVQSGAADGRVPPPPPPFPDQDKD